MLMGSAGLTARETKTFCLSLQQLQQELQPCKFLHIISPSFPSWKGLLWGQEMSICSSVSLLGSSHTGGYFVTRTHTSIGLNLAWAISVTTTLGCMRISEYEMGTLCAVIRPLCFLLSFHLTRNLEGWWWWWAETMLKKNMLHVVFYFKLAKQFGTVLKFLQGLSLPESPKIVQGAAKSRSGHLESIMSHYPSMC